MDNKIAKWATAAGAVVVLALGSGCARIQHVDSLEADIQAEIESLKSELAANRDATASAMAEAEAARAAAGDAAGAAGDAASAAGDAMSAASDAQAGSAANAEKIDRMFEKVMMK